VFGVPQLNVHIPQSSDLYTRVERYAELLGLSTSTLARAVLDTSLEAYVDSRLAALTRAHRQVDSADEAASSVGAPRGQQSGRDLRLTAPAAEPSFAIASAAQVPEPTV
jgi:hypothetical protein